ncbi:putative Ribosomal RNA small subunit methyltransferase D [Nitrospira moscoviensis]|uniref:Putative Ribosomal RNA small subunit methyltransferase D n=2 Tax=Nitrospira moscoviensis TaxID=42253 RepID=A0A0K2GBZ6_NITMO|nr:putative Ribosomal RNA small subunit methyltransferase D [Nitrospira moscoviensis]
MRVIAGTHRGRRLRGPRGTALRPTSDRVREALFSILGPRVVGCRLLDLYAGTGAIGIEAVSRGAAQATCVESQREALALLRHNVADCGLTKNIMVRAQTVQQFLRQRDRWNGPYDIVFADPPYADAPAFAALVSAVADDTLLAPDARVIIEHATKTPPPAHLGAWALLHAYRYGDTSLSLYAPAAGAAP